MSATIRIYDYAANVGVDITDVDSIVFRTTNADSTNQDLSVGSLIIPLSGTAYSYEKVLRMHVDWSVGATEKVSNLQAFCLSSAADTTGVGFSVGTAEEWAAPIATDSQKATLNFLAKDTRDPILLTPADQKYGLGAGDHIQIADLGAIGDFIVLQMDVLSTATVGDFQNTYGFLRFYIRYDIEEN